MQAETADGLKSPEGAGPLDTALRHDSAPTPAHLRAAIARHWRAFWSAVEFLTRVPVPARLLAPADASIARLQTATIYFPLVGAFIGLICGATIWLASQLWPVWLAVLFGLTLEALLTGALHEDGLADCCDALGGGWTRSDVLRILDDSRLGTYGTLGLTICFLLRAGAIGALPAELLLPAIVCSASVGRWAMVLAMVWLAPVPERRSLAQQTGGQQFSVHVLGAAAPALIASLPLAALSPARFVLSMAVVIGATAAGIFYLRRRIGGVTGDCLGAICYASQLLVLLCAAARVP